MPTADEWYGNQAPEPTARDILLMGQPSEYLPGLLDEYRDEILRWAAERIRAHGWDSGCAAGCCDDETGAFAAADLIDPKVINA